jgi:hypothetical protein
MNLINAAKSRKFPTRALEMHEREKHLLHFASGTSLLVDLRMLNNQKLFINFKWKLDKMMILLVTGAAGDWTPDFSHTKRALYLWVTIPIRNAVSNPHIEYVLGWSHVSALNGTAISMLGRLSYESCTSFQNSKTFLSFKWSQVTYRLRYLNINHLNFETFYYLLF